MKEKICSFFGHAYIDRKEEVYQKILHTVEELVYNEGCYEFWFGGYGEFDTLCHAIVTEIKKRCSAIRRVYCYSDEKQLLALKRRGEISTSDYEEIKLLPLTYNYWYTRIYYRNCKMIDASDTVIFYAESKEDSGAYKALKYAIRTKKRYVNLF